MLEHLIKQRDHIKVYKKRQQEDDFLEQEDSQLIKGEIFRIVSDTEIEAELEKSELEFEKDVCYVLYMFSYEKVYLCEAYYRTEDIQEEKRIVSFEILSPLERIQRRMHVRVSCRVSLSYRITDGEEISTALHDKTFQIEEKERTDTVHQETMIDLSAGGIRFTTAKKLHYRDYLHVVFSIPDQEERLWIESYGQVIFADTFRGEDGLYDIRFRFIGMPEHMKEKIIHYVFYLERENRKVR